MRHPPWFAVAPLLLILLPAAQTHGAPPAPSDIEKAIRELGAADYRTRERASAFLQQAGAATEAPLRKAIASDDPEISERARIILDNMDFQVGPDTPKAVIDAVALYKTGEREAAIQQLAALDLPGIITLLAIQERRPDKDLRPLTANLLAPNIQHLFPALLATNETDAAGQLLEVCAETGEENHIRSHAAWLLIRGGLQDRIARLKALPSPEPATLRQLVYLHRADGNLTNALEYAIRLSNPDLTRQVRFELGDWKALATDPGGEPGIERLGFQAAYHRLSGNKPAFEAALTNIHTYAEHHPKEAWHIAEALLINNRPRDAVAALTQMGQYELACKILDPTGHEAEVFRIIARARQAKSDELPALEQIAASRLTTLGSTNEARTIITNLIANTTITTNIATYTLIGTAKDIGLVAEAASLAASVLGTLPAEKTSERRTVLQCLFPEFATRADAWLSLLRETSAEGTLTEQLARLHGYFTARPESLRAFISLADKATPAIQKLPGPEQTLLWQSLADAHKCLNETNQVVTCERRACDVSAGDGESHLRLARAAANAFQWRESAAAARRAYNIRREPASLWASGWALAKAGDEKAGREAMDRANLMALDNDEQRYAMAETMKDYGASDAAVLQQGLILRLGRFDSWELWRCAGELSWRALKAGDFRTSSLARARFGAQCLYTHWSLLNTRDYSGVAYWASMSSALASIGQGRFEEAMEQARHQQEHWPCDDDLPPRLGPALEKAGRRDLANELFATVLTNNLALLRQYPNSAGTHNRVAWLCARTRRELATGLEHSRKALDLSPDDHGCRDTLAEVLFQLGRRDEAVAEMRKCIEQAPARQYYRRQLKRMQDGDPSSDPSDEHE